MLQPFTAGSPVTGKEFFGREKEIQSIKAAIDKNNFAVVGLRRTGKTSLMLQMKDCLKKDYLTIYLDISKISPLTEENFLKHLFLEVIREYSHFKKQEWLFKKISLFAKDYWEGLTDFIKGVHINIKDIVEVWFEHSQKRKGLTELTEKTFLYLESIAEELNKNLVIFLDEFQTISNLGNKDFEWSLRSNMQMTKKVKYVVSSSSLIEIKELMEQKRAFFGFFLSITLLEMEKEAAEKLLKRLNNYGVSISNEIISKCLEKTLFPLYLQAFGLSCFLFAKLKEKKSLEKEDFDSCWGGIFDLLLFHFEELESRLTGLRKSILTMIVTGKESPEEIARGLNHEIEVIRVYLTRMEKEGYLERTGKGQYDLRDSVFKEWLMKGVRL